ncbi:MAG: NifB/NifX family molybdenum-iron cluster-binding protein [Fastidiosipilaceae bacterium]|jgi:predicted outer membrane repeat protein|nr:dinitrogenase iron-molybdenum cofactor biosynthesis protein [Clostridiaceae bacterium]
MKIAIPVNEKNMQTDICESFGRAPYYLIYDTEKDEATFIDNSAATSTGGAGIKAAQVIVDSGAKILLTPRCGEKAANVLMAADIKLFKSIPATAQANIDAYLTNKLDPLDEIHAGFHGHGGN